MILRATNLTFAEARATAVSAKISTTAEPILSSALLRKKHSSTVSIKSDTYKIPNIVAEEDRKARSRNKYNTLPIWPQILACIDGYISTSWILRDINFSSIWITFCFFVSSEDLQNLCISVEGYKIIMNQNLKKNDRRILD